MSLCFTNQIVIFHEKTLFHFKPLFATLRRFLWFDNLLLFFQKHNLVGMIIECFFGTKKKRSEISCRTAVFSRQDQFSRPVSWRNRFGDFVCFSNQIITNLSGIEIQRRACFRTPTFSLYIHKCGLNYTVNRGNILLLRSAPVHFLDGILGFPKSVASILVEKEGVGRSIISFSL